MGLQLGDTAPNFDAQTNEGSINFYSWMNDSWTVLFSHPKDFTPVCTTELGQAAKLKAEFDKRNVKIIALSVDSAEEHKDWIQDINETQNTVMNFPIIADQERSISNLYQMIHPNADDSLTVRSVFIIGPDKKIKLMLTYPASTGRNFDEILRVIDSMQLTEKRKLATPVNWQWGDDCVIIPSVSNEQAKELFPNGYNEVKPYLRFTTCPEKM